MTTQSNRVDHSHAKKKSRAIGATDTPPNVADIAGELHLTTATKQAERKKHSRYDDHDRAGACARWQQLPGEEKTGTGCQHAYTTRDQQEVS